MPPRNKAPRNTPPPVRTKASAVTTPSSPTLKIVLSVVALIALVAVAYSNSLSNGFVWDDHQQIALNPYLKAGAPIAPLFTGDVRFAHEAPSVENKVYRPLQLLTYRITAGLFGTTPDAFHAVSLLFTIAATLAAFAVFWLLTRRIGPAFAAAALFAVYPIHAEAVDWIAALPDLGCTLFLLAAFAFFFLAHPTAPSPAPSKRRVAVALSLSVLSYAAALLWKETALIFPLFIMAYAATAQASQTKPGSRLSRALQQSSLYWGALVAYLALRFAVLGTLSGGTRDWALSPLQSVLTQLYLVLLYWIKLILPLSLNAYYVFRPIRSVTDPRALLAALVCAAIIAGILYLIRRTSISARLAAFAALWVCIALVPALNLAALGRNAFSERYLYLPSAGFSLLLVLAAEWLAARLPAVSRRPTIVVALAVILAAFTAETIARNPDWKDDATLFTQTLKQSPDSQFVRIMAADAQSDDASQTSTAEQNYRFAIDASMRELPLDRLDAVAAYQGLASLYADHAQDDRALQVLSQAAFLAPHDPNVLGQRGMILAREGHTNEAEPLLNQSLAAQPNNENALSALGLIARDQHHDLARAAELFSKAIAAHPEKDSFSASQHNNLGAVYGDEGDMGAAITEFREAVTIFPEDPEFHMNLASALAAVGRTGEARAEEQTAQRMGGSFEPNPR